MNLLYYLSFILSATAWSQSSGGSDIQTYLESHVDIHLVDYDSDSLQSRSEQVSCRHLGSRERKLFEVYDENQWIFRQTTKRNFDQIELALETNSNQLNLPLFELAARSQFRIADSIEVSHPPEIVALVKAGYFAQSLGSRLQMTDPQVIVNWSEGHLTFEFDVNSFDICHQEKAQLWLLYSCEPLNWMSCQLGKVVNLDLLPLAKKLNQGQLSIGRGRFL